MASWAKPGVKCICVQPVDDLVEGRIYTVHKVGSDFGDHMLIPVETGAVRSWYISRFQPIVTKTQEQDIEMFLRIANDTSFHVTIDEKTNV